MNKVPHIICVGAAVQDVFLEGKSLTAKRDVRSKASVEQFPLGSKIDIDAVHHSTGGGATNAAVTFARQGLRASFVGKLGKDVAGLEVLRTLRSDEVATSLAMYDTKVGTSYSTILVSPNGERVVLNYRGASHQLTAKDINWDKVVGDWLYITSLAGDFGLLKELLRHAKRKSLRVALAPGSAELAKPKKLRSLLPVVDVLLGNAEEMQQLFNVHDTKELMLGTIGMCHYIVVTDGAKGVYVSDSDKIYQADQYKKVKVVDRTGAGDAFGSGFVAAIAQGQSVEAAVTLGSANATSVVQHFGAKTGILTKPKLKAIPLKTIKL